MTKVWVQMSGGQWVEEVFDPRRHITCANCQRAAVKNGADAATWHALLPNGLWAHSAYCYGELLNSRSSKLR